MLHFEILNRLLQQDSNTAYTQDFITDLRNRIMNATHEIAIKQMEKAQQKQKELYDKKAKVGEVSVEDRDPCWENILKFEQAVSNSTQTLDCFCYTIGFKCLFVCARV